MNAKGEVNVNFNRDDLLTLQDIKNVAASIRGVLDPDVLALRGLVEDLRQKEYDPVLFFKMQGTHDYVCDATLPAEILEGLRARSAKDRFLLVLQTKSQNLLYSTWGARNAVTFDATHHTTGTLSLQELTILVPRQVERVRIV